MSNLKPSPLSRRTFVQSAAAAGIAMPSLIPSTAFGANERINTGHIGIGGQGRGNLGSFMSHAIAVCDVDSKRAAAAAKAVTEKNGKAPAVYGDYRKLLEQKDIDAVVISTPDHWHALGTIHACQAGKDVYCEKPLTLTIDEGRKMVQAARENKRIVQTGSQQRSSSNFRQACELVRNGYIGKVESILVGIAKANHPGQPLPNTNPPDELDYHMWLGPAPMRPYNQNRVHYNFRFFWDYSGGQMTNWGAHHIDIAQWGLGRDDSGPVEISGEATFHPQGWHEVSESCRIDYVYDDGVKMTVGQNQSDIPMGTTFIGTKGKIYVNRGVLKSEPEEIIQTKLADDDIRLYDSKGHHANFLDCIKSRELPICDVEIGHRTATCCHLGNIAIRTGKTLKWDPETERFADQAMNEWLSRPYRAPWNEAV